MGRETSYEAYVLDLCDDILGERALRRHRFGWLRGDPGENGARRTLLVDAYWPGHGLDVEYRERQHDEPVTHFDNPTSSRSAASIAGSSAPSTTPAGMN